jgi:hypothetical protein
MSSSARSTWPGRAKRFGVKYGLTEGRRGDPLRPDVPWRQCHGRPRHRRPRPRLLAETLRDDHVLLVRLHPFVRSRTAIGPELAGFAIDVSDHPDINELMLGQRRLVTDYSSADLRVRAARRRWSFFAPDYEAYEAERGFYFDYRTGSRARSSGPATRSRTTSGPAISTSDGSSASARIVRHRGWTIDRAE